MWWQALSDAYHSAIQPSPAVTVKLEYETVYSWKLNFEEILQISRRFPGGGKIIPLHFQVC